MADEHKQPSNKGPGGGDPPKGRRSFVPRWRKHAAESPEISASPGPTPIPDPTPAPEPGIHPNLQAQSATPTSKKFQPRWRQRAEEVAAREHAADLRAADLQAAELRPAESEVQPGSSPETEEATTSSRPFRSSFVPRWRRTAALEAESQAPLEANPAPEGEAPKAQRFQPRWRRTQASAAEVEAKSSAPTPRKAGFEPRWRRIAAAEALPSPAILEEAVPSQAAEEVEVQSSGEVEVQPQVGLAVEIAPSVAEEVEVQPQVGLAAEVPSPVEDLGQETDQGQAVALAATTEAIKVQLERALTAEQSAEVETAAPVLLAGAADDQGLSFELGGGEEDPDDTFDFALPGEEITTAIEVSPGLPAPDQFSEEEVAVTSPVSEPLHLPALAMVDTPPQPLHLPALPESRPAPPPPPRPIGLPHDLVLPSRPGGAPPASKTVSPPPPPPATPPPGPVMPPPTVPAPPRTGYSPTPTSGSPRISVASAPPSSRVEVQKKRRFFRASTEPVVAAETVATFTRQLSVMLSSGLPLLQALIFFAESSTGHLASVVDGLATKVSSGFRLSAAMAQCPAVFNEVYVGLIELGETTSHLDEALEKLAELLEKQVRLSKRVSSALVYPAFLMLVCAGAIGVFLQYVLPTMIPLFTSFGMELPLPTRMLLYSRHLVWPSLISAVVLTISWQWIKPRWAKARRDRAPWARSFDRALLKVPLIGKFVLQLATARVLFALATMLETGLPVLQALKRCESVAANLEIAHRLEKAGAELREGSTVVDALQMHQVLPSACIHLLAAGEETAHMAEMVSYSARFYEEEVDHSITQFMNLIEPFIMVVMGLVVAFIVLAAVLPTVDMINHLG